MIVESKREWVNGNTVLTPEAPKKDKTQEALEKAKRESLRNKKNKRMQKRAKVLGSILLTFVVGMVIVTRYAMIYNTQKEILQVRGNISNLQKENENLRVQLVQFKNLRKIEEVATTKLHMVKPNRADVYYVNLKQDRFQLSANAKEPTQEDWWNKIKNLLF